MQIVDITDAAIPAQPARDTVIREAQQNVIARMNAEPEKARSTIVTTGRVENGLVCTVQQGKFTTVMDLGRGMGGDASAPSPGFYARAAVAGCVAIAIKMLAARESLVFAGVEVTVETDFDDSALFGLGSSSAAPTETRVNIDISSSEPAALVQELVGRALEMDPWYLALRDTQTVWPRLALNGEAVR